MLLIERLAREMVPYGYLNIKWEQGVADLKADKKDAQYYPYSRLPYFLELLMVWSQLQLHAFL